MRAKYLLAALLATFLFSCNENDTNTEQSVKDTVFLENPDNKNVAPINNNPIEEPKKQNDLSEYFYKHFEGTIDEKNAIVMELIREKEKISGQYYYKKVGKPIDVSGTISPDGAIDLQEFSDDGQTGAISGQLSGNKLSGNWLDMINQKSLPLMVEESYNGAIPLKLISKTEVIYVKNNPDLPSFTYYISLLLPEDNNKTLSDSIFKKIFGTYNPTHSVEQKISAYIESNSTEFLSAEEEDLMNNWESYLYCSVLMNSNDFLTMEIGGYYYEGGAHGNSYAEFIVYDKKNDKVLKINDIISLEGSKKAATQMVKTLMNQMDYSNIENMEADGFETSLIKPNKNFYLTPYGICFYFNPYEIAPYAVGSPEIFLKFEDISTILKDKTLISRLKK